MFDSQLHRQYVLGLAIFNTPADAPKFIFVLIDRVGVACTTPVYIRGVHATVLARIIFAFAYASDAVLGVDTRVSFDRLTGDPLSVIVEDQVFTIITEIYISPYVFGRGTRVYLVRDVRGCFHILKDSWIRSSHSSSEIEFIKKIAEIVQSEHLGDRAQVLSPRFVAGDEHICNTDDFRHLLTALEPAHIHRRIVTGPIGDPITSYRSRVECLQALVDVLDQLKFLNDKCGLVHGDVSLYNVTIVRFLRQILAASPPIQLKQANTDAPQGSTVIWEEGEACPPTGLVYELASGGSLIDYDYTREKNKPDSTTSGTLPYMAVALMKPRDPIAHRMDHDLESVCYVLLHIVRFSLGPVGTRIGGTRKSHRVAWWHHQRDIKVIKDNKVLDMQKIIKHLERYLSEYW
ncbi:hypothetical protein HYPSUDRAFT_143273 [Hypholoma sublateritium FD-334 SS-4]|uniref:Fungal-type protein kinase domain-containing protein n=1 Tax=Hypholoma sublateritium (strain FD-334 SS-4) TaxID=945553 RepID=A0A0D2PIM1_HYPSF|nr:hypothetical protein HYPSUDRAFT_143273 [Hypholoma sublateritium FD-334 SS-4]